MLEVLYTLGEYTGMFPPKTQTKDYKNVLNILVVLYAAVGVFWFGVNVLMTKMRFRSKFSIDFLFWINLISFMYDNFTWLHGGFEASPMSSLLPPRMMQYLAIYKATLLDRADAVYSMESECSFLYFYMISIYTRKPALELFRKVSDFTTFGKPKTLEKEEIRIKIIYKIIVGYGILAPLITNGFYFATYDWCMRSYTNDDDIQYCGYTFGIYYPYNFRKGVPFIIHTLINYYAFVFLSLVALTLVGYTYCVARYFVVKIDHLNTMLSEVLKNEAVNRREHLKKCIKYHNHIISLVDGLNELHSMNNAPAIFLYSTIIGVCLFSLTKEYKTKAIVLVCGYIGGVFCLNFAGQMIFEKSETVGVAAYNMEWYNTDSSTAKDIMFIIIRSQVPLKYKAGPFGTMSLVFFGSILRGAYTYMTMQTDIKEK